MQTTSTSKQFTLNGRDLLKGLLVAVITPVFTIIITSLEKGSLTFDWKAIGITAAGAALAYIMKNFLSPGTILITDKATVEAVTEGEATVTVKST